MEKRKVLWSYLSVFVFCSTSLAGEIADSASPEARRKRIEELIAIVNKDVEPGGDPTVVINAMNELGKLRAVEAAPLLADRIDYQGHNPKGEGRPLGFTHPAVQALIDIGEPSIPCIIEAVASRERSGYFQLCAKVAITRILNQNHKEDTENETRKLIQGYVDEYKKKVHRLEKLLEQD